MKKITIAKLLLSFLLLTACNPSELNLPEWATPTSVPEVQAAPPVQAPPAPTAQPPSINPAATAPQAQPAPTAQAALPAQPPIPAVDVNGQTTPAGELPDWFNAVVPTANWSAENTCPPPIFTFGASSVLVADLKFKDAVYHFNVSRDVQASQAAAGPRNESNVLVGLADGVQSVVMVFDGSGYAYPEQMAQAIEGCQLQGETSLRGGNWPTKISGIPEGIFVYFHPFGVKEKPEGEVERWPDKVYGIKWTNASGEHTWISPEWQLDPSTVTAAEWLLSPQGGNLSQGQGQESPANPAPVNTPAPTAVPTPAPTPFATTQPFDPACAANGDIPGGQGEGKTVKACGWVKLSWWVPDDKNEYVLRLYSVDGVTISNFNGTASSWDHEPSSTEWGTLEPKSTEEQAKNAGIGLSGTYQIIK